MKIEELILKWENRKVFCNEEKQNEKFDVETRAVISTIERLCGQFIEDLKNLNGEIVERSEIEP